MAPVNKLFYSCWISRKPPMKLQKSFWKSLVLYQYKRISESCWKLEDETEKNVNPGGLGNPLKLELTCHLWSCIRCASRYTVKTSFLLVVVACSLEFLAITAFQLRTPWLRLGMHLLPCKHRLYFSISLAPQNLFCFAFCLLPCFGELTTSALPFLPVKLVPIYLWLSHWRSSVLCPISHAEPVDSTGPVAWCVIALSGKLLVLRMGPLTYVYITADELVH